VTARGAARRVLVGCGAIVAGAVLVIVGTIAFIAVERRVPLTLPAPTGSFAVGRTILDWKDSTTVDSLAPIPGTKRELLAWIWYPAATAAPGGDDYVPADLRARPRVLRSNPGVLRWNPMTFMSRKTVHDRTSRDAPLSPRETSYPVLLMRGGASSGVLNYSTLAEDLASHGYVVVGFDAPYRTGFVVFPDGRTMQRTASNNPELCINPDPAHEDKCIAPIIAAWTRDLAFSIGRLAQLNRADPTGRFTGRLDLSRVGVFGHSLGGATTAQFCHDDARCRAGVDVDGAPLGTVIREGMRQPFMFLTAEHGDSASPEGRRVYARFDSIYQRLPPDARYVANIRGAEHYLFGDDAALLKSRVLRGVLWLTGHLRIVGRRQLAVTAYALRTFFDAYLRHAQAKIPAPEYPELMLRAE